MGVGRPSHFRRKKELIQVLSSGENSGVSLLMNMCLAPTGSNVALSAGNSAANKTEVPAHLKLMFG